MKAPMEGSRMKKKPSVNIDRLFHALGDPTRRTMLHRLSQRPMSVSGLAEPLGITLTAVVQHLQILEEVRLVRTEKLGRVRTCSLMPDGFRALEQWIRDHRTPWERRLDRLGDFLSESGAESDPPR
ncbi:MAG: metalloregulator ArsR/SmtB family transcription factor [Terracidiphilus sp.]